MKFTNKQLSVWLGFCLTQMVSAFVYAVDAPLQYGNIIYVRHMTSGLYLTATQVPSSQSPADFALNFLAEDNSYDRDTMWEVGPLSLKGQTVSTGSTITLRSVEFDYYLASRQSTMNAATGEGAIFGIKDSVDTNSNWVLSIDQKSGFSIYLTHANTANQATGARWYLDWNGSSARVAETPTKSVWFTYEVVAKDVNSIPAEQPDAEEQEVVTSEVVTTKVALPPAKEERAQKYVKTPQKTPQRSPKKSLADPVANYGKPIESARSLQKRARKK